MLSDEQESRALAVYTNGLRAAADELPENAALLLRDAASVLDSLYADRIQAERDMVERCAKVADMHDHRGDIAAAIRKLA